MKLVKGMRTGLMEWPYFCFTYLSGEGILFPISDFGRDTLQDVCIQVETVFVSLMIMLGISLTIFIVRTTTKG